MKIENRESECICIDKCLNISNAKCKLLPKLLTKDEILRRNNYIDEDGFIDIIAIHKSMDEFANQQIKINMKTKNELSEPSNLKDEECPMSNLKNRMKLTYKEIYKTLDFDFLKDEGEVLSIYQEFKNAFLNYNLCIYLNYNKDYDRYEPFVLYNAERHYVVEGTYEFEQTAQMACIEKCFEIIDELGLHLQSVTLLEKFEDWYEVRELDHLQNGTEFKPLEIYNYFKPYIYFSKYRKKY